MKRHLIFIMLFLLSLSLSAQSSDDAKEKKLRDLEEKLEELSTEIEIIKATSNMGEEQEEQKFKIFGFMGTRFSDMNYEDADNNPFSSIFSDNPSFMQTNLNLYFQFTPTENWKSLAEIRFLYQPTGITEENVVDENTAEPFLTRKFIVNGVLVENTAVGGIDPNSGQPVFLEIPVLEDGTPAILVNNFPDGIPSLGLPPGYYPVDFNGSFTMDPQLIGTPVMNSVSTYGKEVYNWFSDQSNAFNYRYGALSIERAWMEWSPKDYLNFRVGKFFTPFGIWNVDHGLPVLMTARIPFLLKYLPETQVGIQTYGTVYLPHTDLEYAVYVSNGRGYMATLEDGNKEKSFGGRLNLKFQSKWFNEFAIGGSGYFGTHTEGVKYMKMEFNNTQNSDGTINLSDPTLSPYKKIWQKFDEQLFGIDMKMKTKGVSVQAEYLYRTFDYIKWDEEYVENNYSIFAPEKLPDVKAFYVQVAYDLPFDVQDMLFTPYFRYENYDGYLASSGLTKVAGLPTDLKFDGTTGGINIRHNSYVNYKLDYTHVQFEDLDEFKFGVFTASAVISF